MSSGLGPRLSGSVANVRQLGDVGALNFRTAAEAATVSLSHWGEGQGEGGFSFSAYRAGPPSPGAERDVVRHLEQFGRAGLSPWGEANSRPTHCVSERSA